MDSSLRLDRHRVPESPLEKEKEEPMEKHTVAAVDVAKVVFDVALSDEPGRVRLTRRLPRGGFLLFFGQLPAATVVMEACGSAHYWARRIQELGIVIPVGAEKVLPQVRALIADAGSDIPDALRPVLAAACEEIEALTERIKMAQR